MQNKIESSICSDPAVDAAKQILYRLLAISLLDPKAGVWQQLDALRNDPLITQAARLIADLPEAHTSEMGLGERPIADLNPKELFDKLPGSAEELNLEYERTFGLLVSNACPTHETEYLDNKLTFQLSNTLADINGFYEAFGLSTSDQFPERQDHIVLELEFMACLLGLVRQAREDNSNGGDEHLKICQYAQQRFLKEHLARWAPAFAKLLSRENPNGFYDAVGVFLSAFIPAERALLGVEISLSTVPPRSQPECPEECEGCQLPTL
ncbi:molecular chaperone [uncultured Gimesia sp.]|uniref:TorD/DmsD family molecular chaperone n=1 Tax=uncultured Gimesia sp. TaxID=1678688 RepID=UPI0026121F2F|nr:molecular chaperone TorD family protein [uncultured Gimesia sp.]